MLLIDHPLELFFTALIVLIAATEVGFRLAKSSATGMDEARREQMVSSRDALGILLSLLLGFTLAMALPRYDQRKQLAVDEANAIGTNLLRAQLLPDPERSKIRALLEQYTETRIAFSEAKNNVQSLDPILGRTAQIQTQLRTEASAAARATPNTTGLFISSLNDTIDLSEKRLAALQNRIPLSIWTMLLLISMLPCFVVGYSAPRRFWMMSIISPLMISIVMGLIADLDNDRAGLIRSSLQRPDSRP